MATLKKGSQGGEVREIQQALSDMGFPVDVDGAFGEQTHNAVVAMQMIFGYSVDGMVGPATQKLISHQRELRWNLKEAQKHGYPKAGA